MEEDLEKLKEFIVPWFPWPIKERKFAVLNEIKYLLWVNMNHECLVSRNDCDEVSNSDYRYYNLLFSTISSSFY